MLVAMAGNPPAKRREHVEMIDRALFAKADIERDDIDTCGMHVGQLPEKLRLTEAPRHAGLILQDEPADDPVAGARTTKRRKSGGRDDVSPRDLGATSAPTRAARQRVVEG